jgi:polyisoprenyl-phosphate glycosyltransferase
MSEAAPAPPPRLSVVIPVYGCGECLEPLHRRLKAVLAQIPGSHEIVFVDDRSPDDAWLKIAALVRHDPCIVAVRLSRNFGQHAAITAGLAQCRGDYAVVMDCDLQDPPEEIPRLLSKCAEGFDIVFARRIAKKSSLFRRLSAWAFFRVINTLNRSALDAAYGSFSVVTRRVVNAFLTLGDHDRQYLLILHWLGYRTTDIDYVHGERPAGRSAYTLRRLVEHAFHGLFFQTTVLLRWIVYTGFYLSAAGLALAGYFAYAYFVHSVPTGWTSLAVLILIVGGFIIASTGITGLYIGKIFEQVKGRPLYVVDTVIGHRGGTA